MAVPAQENQPLEQQIVGVVQETRRVLSESRALFPDDSNGKLPAMRSAIGGLGVYNLAQLSLGKPPHGVGAEGYATVQDFLERKGEWIDEETRLRATFIAALARPLFVEGQNARLAELIDGEQFRVSRLDKAGHLAIGTHPDEGNKRIEGPVAGTLSRPRAELGAFVIMPTNETSEYATGVGYFVNLLDHEGRQQLDLQQVGQAEA